MDSFDLWFQREHLNVAAMTLTFYSENKILSVLKIFGWSTSKMYIFSRRKIFDLSQLGGGEAHTICL